MKHWHLMLFSRTGEAGGAIAFMHRIKYSDYAKAVGEHRARGGQGYLLGCKSYCGGE